MCHGNSHVFPLPTSFSPRHFTLIAQSIQTNTHIHACVCCTVNRSNRLLQFATFHLLSSSLSTCQISKLKVKQQQPQQQPQTQDIAEAKQTLTTPAKFRYPSLTKNKKKM